LFGFEGGSVFLFAQQSEAVLWPFAFGGRWLEKTEIGVCISNARKKTAKFAAQMKEIN
jgi:hypothetical protein